MSQLQARFPGTFRKVVALRPRAVLAVLDRADLLEVCRYLKEELGFTHLSSIAAVDWGDRWESVYHLVRYGSHVVVQLNAIIPYDDPKIDSVTPVWSGADVHEREAWDLMGIEYVGHPDLTRILLPKDFKFHPLRKDFPQEVDRQYVSRRKIKGG